MHCFRYAVVHLFWKERKTTHTVLCNKGALSLWFRFSFTNFQHHRVNFMHCGDVQFL
jgi:hypothetical protein